MRGVLISPVCAVTFCKILGSIDDMNCYFDVLEKIAEPVLTRKDDKFKILSVFSNFFYNKKRL